MQCNECGAWFFTAIGITDHNNFCIGYNPEAGEHREKTYGMVNNGVRNVR